MKNRILVVDDEPSMREMLAIMLFKEGFEVLVAESRAAAAKVFAQGTVDMVITDVKLPDGDGIEILRHVKAASPQTVVIVMTAFGSTETAVAALKLGAHDYLVKPFDVEELKIVVRGALESQHLKEENLRLRAELDAQHGIERIVATSPPMAAVVAMVRSVAPTGSTVLITGESGTGKELVAQAIHSLSPRRDAPFVSINCGALPETLLESEMFGHMRGRLHRRPPEQEGAVRGRPPRHAVPGRGGGDAAVDAGEAPARAAGEDDPARRRNRGDRGGRAGDRRHQPAPRGPGPGEALAGGPVLPAERHPHPAAAAAGPPRGHPDPRPALPGGIRARSGRGGSRRSPRRR